MMYPIQQQEEWQHSAHEWCEHDPIIRYVDRDGQQAAVHVLVAVHDTKEDRQALHEWSHARGVVAGNGVIVVSGPPVPYRAWCEVRHPKPTRTFGHQSDLHEAGETVSIAIDL